MKRLSVLFLLFFGLSVTQIFGQQIIGRRTPNQIAAGAEGSWSGIIKYGRNADVDQADDPETIWALGGIFPGQHSTFVLWPDDSTVSIISSSSDDDTSGTGGKSITIYGVDSLFARISERISLGGTDAVELANAYRMIYRAVVDTAGSGLTNAGNLYIASEVGNQPDTLMVILAGDAQSMTTVFPIAAGETGFLYSWGVSNITASADITAELMIFNVLGNVWNVKDIIHSRTTGNTYVCQDYGDFPLRIDGPAVVRIDITTDTDDTDVTGLYTMLYR